MAPHVPRLFIIALSSYLLAACQTVSETKRPTIQQQPSNVSATLKLPALPQVFYLDPELSSIIIHVYRGGRLGRLGHNHVISPTNVRGLIYYHPDMTQTGFDIVFPVTELEVDSPTLRAKAGEAFRSDVKPKDIAGTRNNMLSDKVLDAANNPFIHIHSLELKGNLPVLEATLAITLKGVTRTKTTKLVLTQVSGQLIASGQIQLLQSDFDISPLSILGGAIKVKDAVDIHYRLVGTLFE